MSDKHYDIAIIGGGNAGFGVSQIAHAAGKSIAFIEADLFGGTCPNRGCTPKKVLVAAAQAMHDIELAEHHGIEVGTPKLHWDRLLDRKSDMIDFIPGAMQNTAKSRGDVYTGQAVFTGPNTLLVAGETIAADQIVIATGSITRPLDIPGAEHLITSDDVLSEREQPGSVIFIGGGVIAMEFSHVYRRAGTAVTILEAMPQLLPRLDTDAVTQLRNESERIGVTIKTDVKVLKVTPDGGQLRVDYQIGEAHHTALADRVVNGTGRVANVANLDLAAGQVEHDGLRIKVDEYLRSTSNPAVWVAGDALVHSAQLSPLATYEGRTVGHNIVNGPLRVPDYTVVPSAVYTVPALSSVGLTEQEARHQELDFEVHTSDMADWFSSRFYAETASWAKILIERQSRQVLGAHILGHHGEDLIHVFALAMRHKISADDLGGQLYAFPTFSADIGNMVA